MGLFYRSLVKVSSIGLLLFAIDLLYRSLRSLS